MQRRTDSEIHKKIRQYTHTSGIAKFLHANLRLKLEIKVREKMIFDRVICNRQQAIDRIK